MKKVIILTFISFCVLKTVFPFDCREITKEKNYNDSEYIFIGKIEAVEDKYISIKPYEFLKGQERDHFWAMKFNNRINFFSLYDSTLVGQVWIFYADSVSGDTIYISPCGYSTNIYDPKISPPRPHLQEELNSEQLDDLTLLLLKVSAKQDLQMDIETYRTLRKEELLKREKANRSECSAVNVNIYIIGLLILNSLLLTILIFRRRMA